MQIKQIFFSMSLLGTVSLLSSSLTGCSQSIAQMMHHGSSSEGSDMTAAMPHDMGDMDLGPKDDYFDLRFIDGMILHHQGAIAMAESVLVHSERDEMKQLAEAIIAAQQQEIARMQEWRQAWYPDADPTPMMYHADMGHMMPMSEDMRAAMMMDVDLGAADDQFDLRFLNAMIPHHEGAVVMAQQVLESSPGETSEVQPRPELQELAQTIIATQQQEIQQMEQWRQDWYGQ